MKIITSCISIILLSSLMSCSAEYRADFQDKTTIEQPNLTPEGIDFDSKCNCFLVSSVSKGTVGRVYASEEYSELVNDPSILSSIGILVDQERGRLLVAIADSGRNPKSTKETKYKTAKLGIFNLASGKKIKIVDLEGFKPGGHFANDIALDKNGNAYVTDSFAGMIYKVTPEGKASVFSQHSELGKKGSFGPNGIIYHPDGFLLMAKSATNELYKIPLNAPNNVTKIQIDQALPTSPDGLELMPDRTVALMANRDAKVVILKSKDHWKSAMTVKTAQLEKKMPTTVTHLGLDVFAIYSGFNLKDAQSYDIEKVNF